MSTITSVTSFISTGRVNCTVRNSTNHISTIRRRFSPFPATTTAIRAFIKWGDAWPAKHDLSSLRLLGTVGEPINPEAWMWYYKVIGKGRCPIVDTWWQTETGAIMISPLPARKSRAIVR